MRALQNVHSLSLDVSYNPKFNYFINQCQLYDIDGAAVDVVFPREPLATTERPICKK